MCVDSRAAARRRTAACALAAVLLTGACGQRAPRAAPSSPGGAAASPTTPTTPTAPAASPCPPVSHATERWPASVPADLPTLPTARLGPVRHSAGGVTLVPFMTSASLRDGVLFLVEALPRAGYTVGRGDAEATEADAPFVKGSLQGQYRLLARDTCSTSGLLAVSRVTAGSGPLLPMRAGPTATPLPFG